jgi:hypothetical protein
VVVEACQGRPPRRRRSRFGVDQDSVTVKYHCLQERP